MIPRRAASPREGELELNAGRERRTLEVLNTGDRPIQVGSHFHFADVNARWTSTARRRAGFRLDVPAGTSVRFEPGARARSRSSRSAGRGACRACDELRTARERYAGCSARRSATACASPTPTSGSRSRRTAASAATRRCSAAASRSASRWSRAPRPGRRRARPRDHQRRRARPLGHRQVRRRRPRRAHRRARQGRQPGHHGRRPPGAARSAPRPRSSRARAGSSPRAAIDCHVHFISPRSSTRRSPPGITTLIGGGTGPTEGTRATTCTPAGRAPRMHRALDEHAGQRPAARQGQHGLARRRCDEQVLAGAGGFKLHEDWGSTPAAIDACLRVASEPASRSRSTPTRSTRPATWSRRSTAIAGRSIHAYHTEGAGRRPCAGHHRHRRRTPTCCRPRPTRRARTRSTRSTSTSTC